MEDFCRHIDLFYLTWNQETLAWEELVAYISTHITIENPPEKNIPNTLLDVIIYMCLNA